MSLARLLIALFLVVQWAGAAIAAPGFLALPGAVSSRSASATPAADAPYLAAGASGLRFTVVRALPGAKGASGGEPLCAVDVGDAPTSVARTAPASSIELAGSVREQGGFCHAPRGPPIPV